MSRQSAQGVAVHAPDTETVRITWAIDSFYGDPVEPDEIYVEVSVGRGSFISDDLGGDALHFDLPSEVLDAILASHRRVVGNVLFVWRDQPDDVKAAGFATAIPWQPDERPEPERQKVELPDRPQIVAVAGAPTTWAMRNHLYISWTSSARATGYNYRWRTSEGERQWYVERTSVTIRDLAPSTVYTFKVQACRRQVTGASLCSGWTEVDVTSAAPLTSLRLFLADADLARGARHHLAAGPDAPVSLWECMSR